MGTILRKPEGQKQQKLTLSQFYGIKQSQHALYQSKISTKSSKNRTLVKKTLPFSDQNQQINTYLGRLSSLGQHIQGENLYLPVFCEIRENNQFCTDYRDLLIYYQDYEFRIKDEILARKKQYEHFTEQEIWYIIYSLANGLRKFQRFTLKSGNLTTNHLALNQKGHLKLINQLTYPQTELFKSKVSVKSSLQNFWGIFFYLTVAPQQLQKLKSSKASKFSSSRHKIHPNISQTFSMGIIILEISTFIEAQAFYDMQYKQLNGKVLDKAFNVLQQIGYSNLFQSLLRVMLSSAKDRPLPSQIHTVFKPYQRQILNLERFEFQPQRLYDSFYPSQVHY